MTSPTGKSGVYGAPDPALAAIPADARQCSPLHPGAAALEEAPEASLDALVMAAPAATLERRYAMAMALRALRPGGELIAMAGKKSGGQRLAGDLALLGCTAAIESRSHMKVARCLRPDPMPDLSEAIAQGAPRLDEDLGLWTQPGVFSWNRPDPGTIMLMEALPELSGRGADLGCGLGALAHAVLTSEAVTELIMADIDRRAIEMAWRNVGDDRVKMRWEDVRSGLSDLSSLDFVVMNPPFHDTGEETKALGQAFIRKAAAILRKGGALWMVANRHLPYEAVLNACFSTVRPVADANGYKIVEAIR